MPGAGAAGDRGGVPEPRDCLFPAAVPIKAGHADAGVGVAGQQPSGPQVPEVLTDAGVGEPAGRDHGGRDTVGAAEPVDPVGEVAQGSCVPGRVQVVPADHHRHGWRLRVAAEHCRVERGRVAHR